MQFGEGQLAGRAGKLAMSDIRAMGLKSKLREPMTKDAKDAMLMLRARFADNKPKDIALCDNRCPVIIFTDGSFESNKCGDQALVGGVLIDGLSEVQAFGCHVPESLLQRWHEAGKDHLIG